jgi:transcriptional regulator with XRE-family HTH domain
MLFSGGFMPDKKTRRKAKIDEFGLPERIIYLRERRKMTQAQLAKAAGISQSTIAQIESAGKDPSITTLKKLAVALNVHIAVLFAGDEVFVFDMLRLKQKYDHVDKLNETLYYSLGKVIQYAKNIGYL